MNEGTIIASVTYFADKARDGKLYKRLVSDSGYKNLRDAQQRQRQRKHRGGEFKDGFYVIRRDESDEAEFQQYTAMSPETFKAKEGTRFYNPKTARFDRVVAYPPKTEAGNGRF